jgi:hypothetical protein
MDTINTAAAILPTLAQFIGTSQRRAMHVLLRGEYGAWYAQKIIELRDRIASMPVTYAQDGVDDPIATLRYFLGSATWIITEKDSEAEQLQAFGWADLGEPELGYISLVEILEAGAELDLHFEPCPLSKATADAMA